MVICRVWRGWTTIENAEEYQRLLLDEIIPDIEARRLTGLNEIDLARRDLAAAVEFQTIMWFENLAAIIEFVGTEPTVSHVPAAARAILSRYDDHATHYEVVDRRKHRHCSRAAS